MMGDMLQSSRTGEENYGEEIAQDGGGLSAVGVTRGSYEKQEGVSKPKKFKKLHGQESENIKEEGGEGTDPSPKRGV